MDGIFVAKLSEKALTATSLAYPMQLLMVAIGVGTSVGLNAYLSCSVGEKNKEKSSHIATTGMILAVISAVVFMIMGALGAYTFAGLFTDDLELADMCGLYLQICMVFCMGMFVQVMGQRFLQAVGDTVLSMISLIIGAVVNMVLDPVFIFGFSFIPALRIISATFIFSSLTTVLGYSASGLGNGMINMLGTALRQFIIYVPVTWIMAKFGNMNLIWYASWIAEICALAYSAFFVWRLYGKVVCDEGKDAPLAQEKIQDI